MLVSGGRLFFAHAQGDLGDRAAAAMQSILYGERSASRSLADDALQITTTMATVSNPSPKVAAGSRSRSCKPGPGLQPQPA